MADTLPFFTALPLYVIGYGLAVFIASQALQAVIRLVLEIHKLRKKR